MSYQPSEEEISDAINNGEESQNMWESTVDVIVGTDN